MSPQIGAGVSTQPDPLAAGMQAAGAAAPALEGEPADLVIVFVSGQNLAAPEATLQGVHTVLGPRVLVGCAAAGVLGSGRELESGSAVAVWAAALGGAGRAVPFHAVATGDDVDAGLEGLPELEAATGVIMLSDPYSFPVEPALAEMAHSAHSVPVLGGLSSARTPGGGSALFLGGEVCEEGAVGVSLRGVELLACVSQGAAPLGREATITAAEGNVIHELAGRPALETIESIIGELPARDRATIAAGLLIGVVIDGGKPEYEQGDFLVRGVLGADPDSGSVAVGGPVSTGQVVRLHARDARSADSDLRRSLRRVDAMAGQEPAGALVFSCTGRGQAMFGAADHDAETVREELRGAPAAGFFAAGEIGPVGGRSFVHGFTATVAVFPH